MSVRAGRTVVRGGIAVVAIVVWWLALAAADHLAWMHPYKSAGGGSCCGETDCVPATVVMGPDGEVVVNGVPLRLPRSSVHLAPDGIETGWWCYHGHAACQPPLLEISAACARCVFIRGGPGNF